MIVHLCCFWPVKTTGCQLQKTTCDVAGCDVMKREYRYISFWNWCCIWSYTNCRLLVVKTLWSEILTATESKHEPIRISRNEIELFCFLGLIPLPQHPSFTLWLLVSSLCLQLDLAGHLSQESLTVLSWVFILLAVLSAPLMDHASQVGCNVTKWGDRPSVAL